MTSTDNHDLDAALAEVTTSLVSRGMKDAAVRVWLAMPNTWLDGLTPCAAVASGDVSSVRRAVAGLFQD